MNWKKLVAERKEWVDKNFPPDVYEHSLLGMIEEVGELVHHFLKMEQGIRGDREEHLDEIMDAIGDITVYMFGVMYHQEVYPTPDYKAIVLTGPPIDGMTDLLFRLNFEVARVAEYDSLTPQERVDNICTLLDKLAGSFGWDFETIVDETWDQVKRRDWTKNKQDGTPLKDNPYLTDVSDEVKQRIEQEAREL